ncbi:hypothetical protein PACTADRAFT_51819 [Pachysolen tannophilus NRRL Y-2460]|uniref:Ergosterol biosynthesis protein n=1 Tax=Pachysolen tannophilus NRRL Y-2460 TaxID=669874 RepID=A0A1E4TN98_PACTA|nr:hypothetical protein PACTADRAFT_51819 [Pachysolen tannophilus NRRL Y-2460]
MCLALIQSYLPTTPGLLPKWILFISVVSIFNSIQSYIGGLSMTRRVYENRPQEVTPLSARTFGTWTLFSAIIRCYGAYHLTDENVFNITLYSFLIAIAHFSLEWLIYGTCKFGKGLLGPLVVSTSSIAWMTLQRDYYTSF